MGLHAVSAFLREKYPHLIHKEHISLFAHQRVFMDIASYIYKSVCTQGALNAKWFNSLLELLLMLRKNMINIIPVFDGKAPVEKQAEQQARRESRARIKDRLAKLEEALKAFRSGNKSTEVVQVLREELDVLIKKGETVKSYFQSTSTSISTTELQKLDDQCRNFRRQTSYITEQDNKFMRDMFTACGITVIVAPEEAEAYCCWLVRQGFGTAVISCDTDCIAHRAKTIMLKMDTHSGNIEFVHLEELKEAWNLSDDQIVDFACLVGCDYNPGSRKNKIGPTKAVQLLNEFGRIEDIPSLIDVECLKVDLCRRLFNVHYDTNVVIAAGTTDIEQVYKLAESRWDVNREACLELIELNNQGVQIKIKD